MTATSERPANGHVPMSQLRWKSRALKFKLNAEIKSQVRTGRCATAISVEPQQRNKIFAREGHISFRRVASSDIPLGSVYYKVARQTKGAVRICVRNSFLRNWDTPTCFGDAGVVAELPVK